MPSSTANYGWQKPDVAGSNNAWGGMLNADLDGIDSVVHGIQTTPASTTTLGGVKVDGTSIQAATDGTISTVLVPMGDNRIINGDMRIDQRNNGASGTANAYTVDRWAYNGSVATVQWQRIGAILSFGACLGFTSTSSHTIVAGDYFFISQAIEADMITDFQWGTAQAQPVTLSFWANSSVTGAFSGSIKNYAGTRSYPFSFSLLTANAWTKIVITIPGDATGTWVMSGNAGAIYLSFDLGSGATYRGTAGAWANGNYFGATGAQNIVSVNSATFYLTGIKLELGSIATPYSRQSLAKSLMDCQRYYQTGSCAMYASGTAGQGFGYILNFPIQMRAAPSTIGYSSTSLSNMSSLLSGQLSTTGFQSYGTATATAQTGFFAIWTASAEL